MRHQAKRPNPTWRNADESTAGLAEAFDVTDANSDVVVAGRLELCNFVLTALRIIDNAVADERRKILKTTPLNYRIQH